MSSPEEGCPRRQQLLITRVRPNPLIIGRRAGTSALSCPTKQRKSITFAPSPDSMELSERSCRLSERNWMRSTENYFVSKSFFPNFFKEEE
ncbi:hypothetical protein AVEN_57335-1 [Araneus ventricosus]|uniref:Uncharacterized protein n=1 Tax=Araneus ventricosus TaxID=182803 RepID=A0A4Y2INW2_ARAVE|nr:hypothetical protein AVEN_57335-1 [Araneus ventricosus]